MVGETEEMENLVVNNCEFVLEFSFGDRLKISKNFIKIEIKLVRFRF